jgi:hypothetical protein
LFPRGYGISNKDLFGSHTRFDECRIPADSGFSAALHVPAAQGFEAKSALPVARSTGSETCSSAMSH